MPTYRTQGKRSLNFLSAGALYGDMIFGRGYFHGDPHPGNHLVLKDGRIGLIDFGLSKELPENFATQVATMMVSALIGDNDAAMAAAEQLGFAVEGLTSGSLRALVLMIMGDSDGEQSFFEVLGENEIREIPSHFGLVARTLVLLNGLSHRLAPGRRLIQGALLQELAQAVQKQTAPRA
jgi:ubiquinone biosynthesis protein